MTTPDLRKVKHSHLCTSNIGEKNEQRLPLPQTQKQRDPKQGVQATT